MDSFSSRYELLKVCERKADGGFQVLNVGDEASSLARWIQRQKEKYKLYKLEPGREVLLRKLDFRFPDRPPREEKGGRENSEGLKETIAGIDTGRVRAELHGAAGTTIYHGIERGSTSMVGAIVNLAGEDSDLGTRVGDAIGLLSKFMSVSPEELATRMSAPLKNRPTDPPTQKQEENAFGTLMPLIVTLRETASESDMQDCVEFLTRMVRQFKVEGSSMQSPKDPDPYNKLLALAVELGQELDQSQRSKAVIESCARYFCHIMGRKRSATAVGGGTNGDSAAKKPRTSLLGPPAMFL